MSLSHYVYIGPYLEVTPLDGTCYREIQEYIEANESRICRILSPDCAMPDVFLIGPNVANDWSLHQEARCPDKPVWEIPDQLRAEFKAEEAWGADILALAEFGKVRLRFGVIFNSM